MERKSHYYGDIVRRLFLAGGLIMIVTLPWFNDLLPAPVYFSTLFIVGLGVFAGMVAPLKRWIILINVLIAGGSFLVFEYYAAMSYLNLLPGDRRRFLLFLTDQLLAIIFFIALYFGSKTARAEFFSAKRGENL